MPTERRGRPAVGSSAGRATHVCDRVGTASRGGNAVAAAIAAAFVSGVVEPMMSGLGGSVVHRQVGRLPDKLMQMVLSPRLHTMELELLAFTTGDRDVLVHSVLSNPRTRSPAQAEGIVDTLLGLPWNRDLAERFRRPPRPALAPYDLPVAEAVGTPGDG